MTSAYHLTGTITGKQLKPYERKLVLSRHGDQFLLYLAGQGGFLGFVSHDSLKASDEPLVRFRRKNARWGVSVPREDLKRALAALQGGLGGTFGGLLGGQARFTCLGCYR